MATRPLKQEEVTLTNGDTVTIRSVPINRLRRVMRTIGELNQAQDEVEALDATVRAGLIVFEHLNSERLKSEDEEARFEEFGELVDLDSLSRIVEVGAGVSLNDPNPQPAGA